MNDRKKASSDNAPEAATPPGMHESVDACPDVLFSCSAEGRWLWLSAAIVPLTRFKARDLLGHPCSALVAPRERRRLLRTFLPLVRPDVTDEGEGRTPRRTKTKLVDVPNTGIEGAFHVMTARDEEILVTARVQRIEDAQGEVMFVGVLRQGEVAPVTGVAPTPSPAPITPAAEPKVVTPTPATPPTDAVPPATPEIDSERLELLATMTHEMRTPMNGILGTTHLLLETPLDERQRQMVDVIHTSSRALLNLINETLDFSKLGVGKLEIEEIDFDLRVTVDQVGGLLKPLAGEKKLEFDWRVLPEVPSLVRGDPSRLRQVLINLGGNAIKFTESGAVSIRVERAEEDDTHVMVRFVVVDTGIGIAEAKLPGLFRAFEQGDPSIARRFGGTGLGLAVSRRLVELMGGRVGVESAPNKGSSFWFETKLAKRPTAEAPVEPPVVELRGLRVLVADISQVFRSGTCEVLEAWGCRPEGAETGAEAFDRLVSAAKAGEPFKVAILDMQLPDMGGEELGAKIRDHESLLATRLLLQTAVGNKGDAARVHTQGFSAYLMKPVAPEVLRQALLAVMRQAPPESGKPTAPLVTRHSIAEAHRSQVRILLVEDNPVNQLVTTWALRRHGYSLEVAACASDALERIAHERYDLILMDIHMPDMNGYETTRRIRQMEGDGPRTPIVAMTADSPDGELRRCREAGMDALLPKPVDLGALSETVEKYTKSRNRGEDEIAALAPDVVTIKVDVPIARSNRSAAQVVPAPAAPQPAAETSAPAAPSDETPAVSAPNAPPVASSDQAPAPTAKTPSPETKEAAKSSAAEARALKPAAPPPPGFTRSEAHLFKAPSAPDASVANDIPKVSKSRKAAARAKKAEDATNGQAAPSTEGVTLGDFAPEISIQEPLPDSTGMAGTTAAPRDKVSLEGFAPDVEFAAGAPPNATEAVVPPPESPPIVEPVPAEAAPEAREPQASEDIDSGRLSVSSDPVSVRVNDDVVHAFYDGRAPLPPADEGEPIELPHSDGPPSRPPPDMAPPPPLEPLSLQGPDAAVEASNDEPAIDATRLEESSMGIPALRDALLHAFMNDIGPRMDRMAEAIAETDARRLEFEAHGLKGMSATIGANGCTQVFSDLERLGREQALSEASTCLERARAEVDRAKRHIENEGGLSKAA